jgi:hypothetical protein
VSEDKIRRKEPIIEPPPNLPFVRRAPPIDAVFSFEIGISMYCSNEKLPIFISASFLFHQYLFKHIKLMKNFFNYSLSMKLDSGMFESNILVAFISTLNDP